VIADQNFDHDERARLDSIADTVSDALAQRWPNASMHDDPATTTRND
jgi:hypothetical protein